MKKLFIFLAFMLSIQIVSYSQTYKDWEYKNIDKFYEKITTESGTLGDDGREISCVFVPTTIKIGIYEVAIADYKNDLYEIKGTKYFVKFTGYFGYGGYGKAGVLEVRSAYSSTFYRKPD